MTIDKKSPNVTEEDTCVRATLIYYPKVDEWFVEGFFSDKDPRCKCSDKD